MVMSHRFSIVDKVGQIFEERCHRDDIQSVVGENILQHLPVAMSKPIEIALGNLEAGNVPVALHSEHMLFYCRQAGIFQAMGEQSSARVEQIDMGHGSQRVPAAIEDEPCRKKVQVICPAVEGHQKLLARSKVAEIPSMAPSSEKSRAKSWQVMKEPASNHPSPMRKGKVPVPPISPVVSVSRNRPPSMDICLRQLRTRKEGCRCHAGARGIADAHVSVDIISVQSTAGYEEATVWRLNFFAGNDAFEGCYIPPSR